MPAGGWRVKTPTPRSHTLARGPLGRPVTRRCDAGMQPGGRALHSGGGGAAQLELSQPQEHPAGLSLLGPHPPAPAPTHDMPGRLGAWRRRASERLEWAQAGGAEPRLPRPPPSPAPAPTCSGGPESLIPSRSDAPERERRRCRAQSSGHPAGAARVPGGAGRESRGVGGVGLKRGAGARGLRRQTQGAWAPGTLLCGVAAPAPHTLPHPLLPRLGNRARRPMGRRGVGSA